MIEYSLKGKYQRYKADTATVAKWLASTARSYGYDLKERAKVKIAPSIGGRLKGKARKAAKAATKSSNTADLGSSTDAEPNVYHIQIRDFEPMAKYLANIEDVDIPMAFRVALDRVITVRNELAVKIHANGEFDSEAYESHIYFVTILEKVRLHLSKHLEKQPSVQRGVENQGTNDGNDKALKNMFSTLEVYNTPNGVDDGSESLQIADKILPDKHKGEPQQESTSATSSEYVLEDNYNDNVSALLVFCNLLGDFRVLKAGVLNLWEEYQTGQKDIATVSVAINASFQMARAMEDEISDSLYRSGMVPFELVCNLLMTCRGAANKMPQEHLGTIDDFEIRKSCLFNTILALHAYKIPEDAMCLDHIYNGKVCWYDEQLAGNAYGHEEKSFQDFMAAFEVLHDLTALTAFPQTGGITDELTHAICEMKTDRTKQPPLWFAWALQVYVDILQSDKTKREAAVAEMQQESLRIKQCMLQVRVDVEGRAETLQAASMWDRDPLWTRRQAMKEKGAYGSKNIRIGEPFQFLRRHPVYCGLLIHHMRVTMFNKGTLHYVANLDFIRIVQLYHATRQSGLISDATLWHDLEQVWDYQGDTSFFIGHPPTSYKACHNNYRLSTGSSLQNWASNKRGKSRKMIDSINQANVRRFKFGVTLSRLAGACLDESIKMAKLSRCAIEGYLNLAHRYRFTDSRGNLDAKYAENVEMYSTTLARLSMVQVIKLFADGLQSEKMELLFDYFAMRRQVLSATQSMALRLQDVYDAVGFPIEPVLEDVCDLALAVAAGDGSHAILGLQQSDYLMRRVAMGLTEWLASGNGDAVLKARREKKKLQPGDVDKLKFTLKDVWGLDSQATL